MTTPRAWGERPPKQVEQRIVIERDGTVVARSGKVEYGQGIRTGFAMIVADELDVPPERVRVELGETDRVPWDMGTFGSMSTATDGMSLRAAAARARALLVERASARLGAPAAELETRGGRVWARDGRAISYEDLTETQPLSGAVAEASTDSRVQAVAPDAPRRLEAWDIVTGRARYAADVRLPGMLRGHVAHGPVRGARPRTVNDEAATAVAGVMAVVRDDEIVGVVAQRDEQALAGVRALRIEWTSSELEPEEPVDVELRRDAAVEGAFAEAALTVEAHYHVPHVAHASIGPSAAVADVREHDADLYVTTQRPFGLREEIARLLGLSPERVHVHPQMMSGLYGRGNMNDAALDAVHLSRAVRRPVLVQWTREEEFRLSPHRPALDAEVRAALDATGAMVGWRYRARTNPHTYGGGATFPRLAELTAGRNAVPPYRLGKAEVSLRVVPAAIRTGAFRSLAAAPHVFAIESFIDELAHASGQDPIAFRLRHIDDARLRRVLETVCERSGWTDRPRAVGRGFGAACAVYHGTSVAQVAEVVVGSGGAVRLERVWCAVDAGRLVHPDGARNQIEGGIQQAASWTLLEELRQHDGDVTTATWHDYPIATFRDAPRDIDVVFTASPSPESTGMGEPGSVPTAAAIANAVFAACGARVRRLPLNPPAPS
jgi:CO/xanthine dehydrogenase Mo-binding subunit